MSGALRPAPFVLDADQLETGDGLIARRVPRGTRWYRVYRTERGVGGAAHFGGPDPSLRFNDPGAGASHPLAPAAAPGAAGDAGAYRVCYLGWSPEAAFVEVFFRRLPSVSVSVTDLRIRSLAAVDLATDLTLVCLSGPGLLRLGVSAEVTGGRDYTFPQVVARTLWRHPGGFDGIEYPTRHDTAERSVALFDRGAGAVPAGAVVATTPLDPHGRLVAAWARRYNFSILADPE